MFRKLALFTILILSLSSCTKNITFSQYQSLKGDEWYQNDVLAFEIPIKDTVSYYNLYINLRNTDAYPYSNLFLIARMTFPDRKQVTDTLEYEMTDVKGNFLGEGFSDIKENKLFYKEKIKFNKSGKYFFEVKQAMRKANEIEPVNPLKGVSDVGISVEKIK